MLLPLGGRSPLQRVERTAGLSMLQKVIQVSSGYCTRGRCRRGRWRRVADPHSSHHPAHPCHGPRHRDSLPWVRADHLARQRRPGRETRKAAEEEAEVRLLRTAPQEQQDGVEKLIRGSSAEALADRGTHAVEFAGQRRRFGVSPVQNGDGPADVAAKEISLYEDQCQTRVVRALDGEPLEGRHGCAMVTAPPRHEAHREPVSSAASGPCVSPARCVR